jgi:NAD(P)-dependent dehydrogenase (short-subunit alcohol dehydrogenase family)
VHQSQTLALEGTKNSIRVNCLAPTAATRMTADVMPEQALARLTPEAVSPGLLALVSEDAPTRTILCAGAGSFDRSHVTLTRGVFVGTGEDAPERLASAMGAISDRAGETVPENAAAQGAIELANAAEALRRASGG